MNFWPEFIKLKTAVGGNREHYRYEESFGQPMEEQQHITPMGGDPMQKKMMMWMPVVMLLLFYDLPSGLTLYWSVSNIFSIIQLLIQKRGSNGTAPAAAAK